MKHQYFSSNGNRLMDEKLYADTILRFLYSGEREKESFFINVFSGKIMNDLLGLLNFDIPFVSSMINNRKFLEANGVSLNECLHPQVYYNTPRKIFERQIRYWECRPMDNDIHNVVSPADSKVITGSVDRGSPFFIKNKFFEYEELLGKKRFVEMFHDGDFAIFRLTPDKYHYNHVPVSGTVIDFYEIDGRYHSCNPYAVTRIVTPYSRNRRTVTIMDTDVENGSNIGIVAFIEIVALMIGDIEQFYCDNRYDNPKHVEVGMFLNRGCPKSRFRPGSSTDIMFFQKGRVTFSKTLIRNGCDNSAESRYSKIFGRSIVETEINVREKVAQRRSE